VSANIQEHAAGTVDALKQDAGKQKFMLEDASPSVWPRLKCRPKSLMSFSRDRQKVSLLFSIRRFFLHIYFIKLIFHALAAVLPPIEIITDLSHGG